MFTFSFLKTDNFQMFTFSFLKTDHFQMFTFSFLKTDIFRCWALWTKMSWLRPGGGLLVPMEKCRLFKFIFYILDFYYSYHLKFVLFNMIFIINDIYMHLANCPDGKVLVLINFTFYSDEKSDDYSMCDPYICVVIWSWWRSACNQNIGFSFPPLR